MKQKHIKEIGVPMKYPVKVSIPRLDLISQEVKNKFHNDFDETYNVFMVKLGDLLTEYGVARVDVGLSKYLLGNRETF